MLCHYESIFLYLLLLFAGLQLFLHIHPEKCNGYVLCQHLKCVIRKDDIKASLHMMYHVNCHRQIYASEIICYHLGRAS